MAGATAMANMLRRNSSLTDINLGGNPLDKRGAAVQCYGALAISLALRTNTTLQALRMPSSGIEEAGATYMAHMLVINSTLHSLDLEGVLPSTISARQPPVPAVRRDDPNLDSLIFEEIAFMPQWPLKVLKEARDRYAKCYCRQQMLIGASEGAGHKH